MNTVPSREHGGEFLTVADVAALLQCSEPTVRRRIRAGELPAAKLGRGPYVLDVPRAALEGVAADEYLVDRDVGQFNCSRRTWGSAVTAEIAFRVVLAPPSASRRWGGGLGAVAPAPAIAHRHPNRAENP